MGYVGRRYNLKKIRDLLNDGFNDQELRDLCFYTDAFRPVYDQLAQVTGKDVIINKIIEYADKQELIGILLANVKELIPAKYKRYYPYHTKSSPPHTAPEPPPKSRRWYLYLLAAAVVVLAVVVLVIRGAIFLPRTDDETLPTLGYETTTHKMSPAQSSSEKPTKPPTPIDTPAKPSTQPPTDDAPTQSPIQPPTDAPTQPPTQPPTDAPTQPPTPQPPVIDKLIADQTVLNQGDCTTLRWTVRNAQSVQLSGGEIGSQKVGNEGTRGICPPTPNTVYTLVASGADSPVQSSINIVIIAPTIPPPPPITAKPNHELVGTIEANCSAQHFQGGYLYGGHSPYTYALFNDRAWVRYQVEWDPNIDPQYPSCTDNTLLQYGFGKMYCLYPTIAARLGDPYDQGDTTPCTIEIYSDGIRLPALNYETTFWVKYGASHDEGTW